MTTPTKLEVHLHQQFPSEIEEMQSQQHEQICADFTALLRYFFQNDDDANVGGDTGFYWNNQDDRDRIAPDAYLIRNAGKEPRKSWKFWQELARFPTLSVEFALEVWSEDNSLAEKHRKRLLYEQLNVKEFFELDSLTGDVSGMRLQNGRYQRIKANSDRRLFSNSLNAEIAFENGRLCLYQNALKVPAPDELDKSLKAERERAEQERERAEQERLAKEAALAELAELKAKIQRLPE